MHASRRQALLEAMGPGAAIIPAAPTAIRNNDVEHEYRQDSDLYYLSGFEEPNAVLVLTNRHPEHRAILFCQERDPSREVWDGPRAGTEGAVERFGMDAAFPIGELDEKLPDYLGDVGRVHYRVGRDASFDQRVFRAIDVVRRRWKQGITAPTEIVDPAASLHELRLRKTPEEVGRMERAAGITRQAHLRAMEVARPGRFEYEVEAELLRTFRLNGSPRPAYGSICGAGPNATILHYRQNDRKMEDGDLLLIDAGCELDYYASDVTRTFPINGEFSPDQRAIYEVVLEAQEAAIEAVRPGATLDDVHEAALHRIVQGLLDLGLLEGDLATALSEETYKPFFMHRTSHWLGMDVHDVGAYHRDGKARPLEPGYVLTVEPGIYVAPDAEVDPKWRGIGVRIEDDVLVTDGGHRNLTADIPKTVDGLESLLATRR